MSTRRRTTTRIDVSIDRGVFMISVAAELAEMHPQTLRMYEARGLIEPKRSPKGTRLYSHDDVQRLKRIQEMTTEYGLNLAGVERVLELEQRLERAYTAMLRSDLDALLADLPAARPEPPPRPTRPHMSEVAGVKLAWVVVLVAIWAVSGAGYFWPVWVIPFLLFGAFTKWSHPGGRGRGGPPWHPRRPRSRPA